MKRSIITIAISMLTVVGFGVYLNATKTTPLGAPTSRLERTLLPDSSNNFDIGTSSRPWSHLSVRTAGIDGPLTIGTTSTTTLYGGATSTFNGINLNGVNCSGYDNGGVLTVNSSGEVICDNDEDSGAGTGDAFAWTPTTDGVSTSTLLEMTAGFTAIASSTIGAGAQATGLLINGGATTTGFLTVQDSASSSFTGGISSAGLSSSQGLVITGGNIINTSSASSTFTGAIQTAGLSSSNGLTLTGGGIEYSAVTSALLLSNASNAVVAYAGVTCTNQFVRALDAAGAGTCNSINNGDWSGTDLSVANGGTGLSTFGGTNHILYTTAADALASEAAFTYNQTTDLLTVVSASTTNFSIATWLGIPSAADPTIGFAKTFAIDSTAASSSLRFHDGAAERALHTETDVAFVYSTTTSTSASTTIKIAGPIRNTTYTQIGCTSDGGTARIVLGDGSASTTGVVSTNAAVTFTTLSSNNNFTIGETRYFQIGTWSGTAVKQVSCTLGRRYDAD